MKRISLITILLILILFASSGLSTMDSSKKANSCNAGVENVLVAASANCSGWMIQTNGCYERVCCCDKNGQHWCERCCPDRSGRCIAYRVRC